jgi:alcohol dehydrogenase (cytochrome c)
VTWATGFDEKGRPMKVTGMGPTPEGQQVYPGVLGGTNWYSPSFSPHTGLFYIPAWDNYSAVFVKAPAEYIEGRRYVGTSPRSNVPLFAGTPQNVKKEDEGYGAVRAFDPKTGEKKWEFKMGDVTDAGILTTATDVLFSGGREGYFFALDARNGELLWRAAVGGPVTSGPMTYSVRGRQYVAVSAGNSLFAYALKQ